MHVNLNSFVLLVKFQISNLLDVLVEFPFLSKESSSNNLIALVIVHLEKMQLLKIINVFVKEDIMIILDNKEIVQNVLSTVQVGNSYLILIVTFIIIFNYLAYLINNVHNAKNLQE